MTNEELMDAAKASLNGKWMAAAIATLILAIILDGSSFMLGFFSRNSYSGFVSILIIGPMLFGYTVYISNLVNKESIAYEQLFKGFHNYVKTFLLGLLIIAFTYLWMLLLIVPGIIAALRYSMSFFIMKDNPEMSAMEALNASCEMMKGHKMELFCLNLRFIGWLILGALTFGIGLLFVYPYMQASITLFYQQLRDNNNNTENEFNEAFAK
nr:DUF975 family protein [Prevotella sp.]